MRALIWILSFGVVIASSTPVEAAKVKPSTKNKAAAAKPARRDQGELQTDIKFSNHDLHGQYQTPDEALAGVENEKGLDSLLGVRKHFKDRLQEAAEQE